MKSAKKNMFLSHSHWWANRQPLLLSALGGQIGLQWLDLRGRSAFQSSTEHGADAARAIDGKGDLQIGPPSKIGIF